MTTIARLFALGILSSLLLPAAGTFQPSSIPFTFEPNRGQTDPQVRYLGRASDAAIWFTDSAVVLSAGARGATAQSATIRMTFAGGNRHPRIEGAKPTAGRTNYFPGDSSRWRTNIPQFERVRYSQVYPGIDLTFYGNPSTLEYDWIVQPGADPRAIRMSIEGASSIEIAAEGDLVMKIGTAEIRARKPLLYQKDHEVQGRFVRKGGEVGFEVAAYDTTKELTIDPVLTYATYIGGNTLSYGVASHPVSALTFQDNAYGAATDPQGNIVIVGGTYSSDFPIKSGLYTAPNFGWSGVVMKVNPKAATPDQFIIWSTYLGGSSNNSNQSEAQAQAVAIDKQGGIYVTGYEAGAFPIKSGFQATQGGGTCSGFACHDAFVTKISADGATLVYSTYLGGNREDWGYAIAVDGAGNAFVGGQTQSGGTFPLNKALSMIGSTSSGFITEVAPDGSRTLESTFFNGDKDQSVTAIAADNSGNIFVAGYTTSAKFPTMNAFQSAASGSSQDGFLAEFAAPTTGLRLLYSTYLGGAGGFTNLNALALDAQGNVAVCGLTASPNYPVSANAFQSKGLAVNGVITKLKPSAVGKAQLLYSTYFGGSIGDTVSAFAIDSTGRYIIGGYTYSFDLPVTADGFQSYYVGIPGTTIKSFIAVIDPALKNQLVYGTYFGGGTEERLTALTLDATGIVFVGLTFSADTYASPNAFQPSLNKVSKIFLGRIDMSQSGPVINSANHAASYALLSGFVPGQMITYFGTNLGPAQLQYAALDSNGNLGNSIAGCQVLINGIPAPLLYASANQTSAIVPYGVAANVGNGKLVYSRIVCNGLGSNTWYAQAAAAAPGIFAANDGTSQGAILNQDGSYNSAANPAAPGSIIVFFATGEGTLTPVGQDGHIENGTADTLPKPTQTVQVTFGGIAAASIPYVGVAPQSVDGLLQVNAQIPLTAPAGSVALVLQVGSAKSQANLTVAVAAAQ